MSERPTLTIAVPCPTCGGTKRKTIIDNPTVGDVVQPGVIWTRCPDCTDGTIRQAVSCAGCKHADTTDPWSEKHRVWCFEHDHEFDATHGCLAWQAKA